MEEEAERLQELEEMGVMKEHLCSGLAGPRGMGISTDRG